MLNLRMGRAVQRSWWIALILVAVGVLSAFVSVSLTPPMWQASVTLSCVRQGTENLPATGQTYVPDEVAKRCGEMITAPAILRSAGGRAAGASASQLAARVIIDVLKSPTDSRDSALLRISVTDLSKSEAVLLTQAIASGVVRTSAPPVVGTASEADAAASGQEMALALSIREVGRATSADLPASPRMAETLAAGAVAGLVLGLGLAVLRERLVPSSRDGAKQLRKRAAYMGSARAPRRLQGLPLTAGHDCDDPQAPIAVAIAGSCHNLEFSPRR